jgi:AsmA protein
LKKEWEMRKTMKWVGIIGGSLVIVLIAALLVIPMFIDVQSYKPEIEKQVTKATGRPFNIGGDLRLSLFPWAGLAFSDLHLGNPPSYKERDFLSIKSFDARVKLIPLLSRNIQIERFVIDTPKVVLEKSKEGRGNWEGIGKPVEGTGAKPSDEKARGQQRESHEAFPIKGLKVGEFAINNGLILFIDQASGTRREVSNVSLRLMELSLDQPIRLTLAALMDGKPLSLDGQLGPLGQDPGKGKLPIDISVKVFKTLEMRLTGSLTDLLATQQFDLIFAVAPFSPQKLMTTAGQPLPVATADPQALNRLAFKGHVKGNPQSVSVSDGVLELDESKMDFSLKGKDFAKPDLLFDLKLDKINLDRYLPPPSPPPSKEKGGGEGKKAEPKKTDYSPLRKLVLDGTIQIGALTVKNAKMQEVRLKVVGKNGLFQLDPMTANLYQGNLSTKGSLDVSQDTPKTNVNLQVKGVQAGPLLKDLIQKDFIEGVAEISALIAMSGDEADKIKRTLNGKGQLVFKDGAIRGVDIAGMVRNAKAAFGLAASGEKPKTDFSELNAPYTIADGVVSTSQTTLVSPVLRVLAAGKANLVDETLDFRVEPKFVGTLKGQGDKEDRGGITIPVVVAGTFSSPSFQPDLKAVLEKGLKEGVLPELQRGVVPGSKGGQKTESQSPSDILKGLMKGVKPGP